LHRNRTSLAQKRRCSNIPGRLHQPQVAQLAQQLKSSPVDWSVRLHYHCCCCLLCVRWICLRDDIRMPGIGNGRLLSLLCLRSQPASQPDDCWCSSRRLPCNQAGLWHAFVYAKQRCFLCFVPSAPAIQSRRHSLARARALWHPSILPLPTIEAARLE